MGDGVTGDRHAAIDTMYEAALEVTTIDETLVNLICDTGGGTISQRTLAKSFLNDLSKLRYQMDGEDKEFDSLRRMNFEYGMSFPYKAWKVGRTELDYDPLNEVESKIRRHMTDEVACMKHEHVLGRFLANPAGFDGTPLIDASHPFGPDGSVQSNLSSAAGLTRADYDAARTAMTGLRTETGKRLNIRPDSILVASNLLQSARDIFAAERVVAVDASGAEASSGVVAAVAMANTFAGEIQVVEIPDLPDNGWILMDSRIKPWLLRMARNPESWTPSNNNSDSPFRRREYEYAVEFDVLDGPADWRGIHSNLPSV